MRTEFILASVVIYLDIYLSVEDFNTCVSPDFCLFEFREECTCSYDSQSLKKKVVALL